MTWTCAQLEERLSDYLEGRLSAAELAAAEAHARACARCGEWAEAREATLWLRQVEPLETPPGLETRILALTVAPPPQESTWAVLDRGWRTLGQPRFAMGLAAAVFSLVIVLNGLGLSVRNLRAADLYPANLYHAANRQAHQTYARGMRFVSDLRLVYEIRSRLEELQPETEPAPAPAQPGGAAPPAPKPEPKKPNSADGAQTYWLLAYHNFIMLRELR